MQEKEHPMHETSSETDRSGAAVAAVIDDPSLAPLREAWESLPDAEWYLVGGAVRDALLGRDAARKDNDFVVRNVELESVKRALEGAGKVDLVGSRFGVLKFTPSGATEAIDIAWPRTERAGGSGGYRDFEVQSDPALPVRDDLARRDLTINAMAWDVRKGELIDPFGGKQDLDRRVLRAVGDPVARFREDHSRMLRTVRFACQLGFDIEDATWEALTGLAHRIDDERTAADGRRERVVPYETVAKEFLKALTADPGRALDLFEKSGLLFRILPELAPLKGCAQSTDTHSEGDAWTHTRLAVSRLRSEEFARRFPGEDVSPETVLAVLFHDLGKPDTASVKGDRITFYGHPERGAEMVDALETRMRFSSVAGSGVDKERLCWLVRMHLLPNLVDLGSVRRTTLERHFLKDPVAGRALLHLAYADAAASIPQGGEPDHATFDGLLALLDVMQRERGAGLVPARLLSGEEVMEATGIPSGPDVGRMLEELREAQLRGEIGTPEEAKGLLRRRHLEK